MLGNVGAAIVASVKQMLHLPEDLPVESDGRGSKPDLPPCMYVVLLATGASLPFSRISERHDQCPFVDIALSADAEWFTRKQDFDRLLAELHFMVLLFSLVTYSLPCYTALFCLISPVFHLILVIEQQISGRARNIGSFSAITIHSICFDVFFQFFNLCK